MRIGAIIQARMGSSRLPGKILKKIDNNTTVLDLLIKRVKLSKILDEIVVAVPEGNENDQIIEDIKKYNIKSYRGSENNVLSRYYNAAKKYNLTTIVRITSDCPFFDPYLMDEMLEFYSNHHYDYVMNLDSITKFPEGLDVEIFSFDILKRVFKTVHNGKYLEHVTKYINDNPQEFKIFNYDSKNIELIKDLRLTLDYKEDLEFIRVLYQRIKQSGKDYTLNYQDILKIVKNNSEIMEINKKFKS